MATQQPLLPTRIPQGPAVETLASLKGQETNPIYQPYAHQGKRFDLTPSIASKVAGPIGYLPHTCARCGHDLRYMHQPEQEHEADTPRHALSLVERLDFLMPSYTEISDCQRYVVLVLFCFTVKYFETPAPLDYTEMPNYGTCAMLTLMSFTGTGVYGLFKYWQSQSMKKSGRYTKALKAARAARDAALLALGTGISLCITAVAIVKSS
ncbi:hypothetical protein EGW08_021355 [Elysia chlorotica]|uniref:Uncharacterized protein n=1 Tax=Elysia chlorotica TaxID=188477 RepID=A0A3S0Z530_ELYCH|nr:hypothetical protein EGW08_021355 [Elysia chlorotica]